MPLRLRSVVPYTLPGVLALIGWWWYISRKKERLISHDSQDGAPTAPGLRAPPAEGSNGLVEKGTISSTNDTESPTHRPPKVSNPRTEHENISQIHGTEAAPLMKQNSEEAAPHLGRIKRQEEVHNPSVSTLPSPGKEDRLQVSLKDHKDPEKSSTIALVKELEEHLVKDPASAPEATVEEVILPCQSTNVTSSCPTTIHLSDAERPEPEGEVAKHYSTVNTQDEMVICAAKVQRVIPSETDSLETPPSARDFHQHILTSTPTPLTPTSTVLTPVINSTPLSETQEGIHGEEQDLELLAAGLITEVISAATQEILGVTSCHVTQPTCSSNTPLVSGRLCSQQEPIAAAQQHHHLQSGPSQIGNEAREKGEQGMPNGCSSVPVWEPVEVSHRVHQTNHAQRGHWLTPSNQAAQSTLLLNMKLKGDEAAALADDSACSTCHSEDGISNEDLQNSVFENQIDVMQVTDLSAKEATRPQSLETATEATEENSLAAVCEIKRLNGMGLRNGAHGTCELETDQSGGSDVNSMDSVDSGCTMGAGESQSNHADSSSSELIIWEIEVPKHLVGRLIGKQGRYVSFLKQNSGAKIYISTLPYTQEFQICHIEGTQQQVDKALSLIGKKFKDLDMTNLYAPPPPPLTLPSLPMTSWLLLPSGVTVEVIVVNIVSAGHVFVQQHTHPTYHALRSLDQQMFLCYSQPGTPALPSPAEVGVICAAPAVEDAWWRAQVITFYKETDEVEIRYVDYGGYDRVKIDSLRQIRSDFVTLPFQGAEVLLDNIAPLPGEDRFSPEATSALEEMTRGVALLAQVSNYDNNTGLPLVHLWNMVGEEVISVNRTLAERGLGVWVEGF
ncbi:A kinase (PRKA) anchor protein 1b [Cyclopterus lumpus]|uniref:A kinase (PRKA) anchor protein 1b n=1 Tax=Cyclopterus lumpus TaxID=8103 RepID=A0A8C2ZAI9_CYCLU|nr:A kinase (PRKA) anchor protein 1b [Cyclopterus lumpus]XP_034384833.1 A kinase (PRKA) anchor protein 1b [Cyclopterus lumpus]XP_034384834.1 A kinase (PRKA) anchor protein 1b [Cyclopterus lumpus]XP_034384835.1 A kinase (PRKA) anchor protein 1b [Cyclopterus lumpus]XP_034384836.1 A kinase (PRKA) anchor protein 1b [Cyclopterus lumpus]XP_034384837.1 A kinase (PRKA) anchor protein 1b [Cyclopterus lumpus]